MAKLYPGLRYMQRNDHVTPTLQIFLGCPQNRSQIHFDIHNVLLNLELAHNSSFIFLSSQSHWIIPCSSEIIENTMLHGKIEPCLSLCFPPHCSAESRSHGTTGRTPSFSPGPCTSVIPMTVF